MAVGSHRFWPHRIARTVLLCFVALCLSQVAAEHGAARADARPTSIRVVADDNYPPYLFRDENGRAVGYLVDFWKLWEKKAGITVEFKPMAWSVAQETIQAGGADVIDTIFETQPRMAIYDFSPPYADLPVNIYTNKTIAGITDTDTLQGFLVGVMDGDACIDILAQNGITYLKKYSSYKNLILAADRGEVKVFCLDEAPANFYFYKLNLTSDFRKAFRLYVGQFHRAVRKGDAAMLDVVLRGANMISAEEEMALREKWLGKPVDIWYLGQKFGLFLLAAAVLSGILLLWNLMLRSRVAMRTADLERALADLRETQSVADDYRQTLEQRVTERTVELNRTAESLRLSNDELHAIFDAATVGIALIRDGVIQSCNSTMEQMFGYRQDELTGTAVRRLYRDDASYDADSSQLDSELRTAGEFRKESQLVRRDGTRFWCRMMVQPIAQLSFEEGFAATFEDITLEQDAIDQIERARKLAEDAVAAKTSFLANMSHEIRTPMNAIIGMTHLAMKADPPAKILDYLSKIDRSSKHLLGIINDILDFSKAEAGKMVIDQANFDLPSLIDNVTGLFAQGLAEKRLALAVDIAPDVPAALRGDPLRISQVLINYLNNAVKFTESGRITIAVRLDQTQGANTGLRFSVQDTGIGLTDEQRHKLFESFQQADGSTTRKFGGTGLGLAISKRLAELMGGKVGVESVPGAGSTFWFTIPLALGTPEAPASPRRPGPLSGRVLVVDDDEAAREVERAMLEEMGYAVATAASGAEALAELLGDRAADKPYDLVLLDWKMPGMDGVATAERIRRSALQKLPLILMVTAYDPQELRQSAPELGHLEVLAKPLSRKALEAALTGLLGTAQRSPQVLAPAVDIRGARALLVEDNELNQEVACEFLKEFGLLVDLAENGAVALQKLAVQAYDVILMDVQMPVMDGFETTIRIRRDPRYAKLPIIAMTASVMEEDQKRCLEAGMNDHVAKPIEPDHLLNTLRKWVSPVTSRSIVEVAGQGAEAAIPLPHVAGLDTVEGLRRANGKAGLYLSLLAKFAASQGHVPGEIAAALAIGDPDTALRLAHTLKGLAGTIGATAVTSAATTLETTIKDGSKDAASAALADLRPGLESLIAGLALQVPSQASPAADPVSSARIEDVCARLRQLLAMGDAEANDVFAGNSELFARAFPLDYPAILHSIESFDYEAALSVLERARSGRTA